MDLNRGSTDINTNMKTQAGLFPLHMGTPLGTHIQLHTSFLHRKYIKLFVCIKKVFRKKSKPTKKTPHLTSPKARIYSYRRGAKPEIFHQKTKPVGISVAAQKSFLSIY